MFQVKAEMAVTVDMGAYEGVYRIDESDWAQGTKHWSLAPGVHNLYLYNNSYFTFEVGVDGLVVSHRPQTATGSLNTLTLSLSKVEIDPADYGGYFTVLGMQLKQGPQSILLIQNLPQRLITDIGGEIASIYVDHVGTVHTAADNLIVDNSRVTFKTVALTVDPADYDGAYMLGDFSWLSGRQTVIVIESAHHRVKTPENGTIANFRVTRDGEVDAESFGHTNIIASPFQMTFKTVGVEIDPAAFTGDYITSGVENLKGKTLFNFVDGAEHRISTGINSTIVNFIPRRDNGEVKIQMFDTEPVSTGDRQIQFKNLKVKIVPSNQTLAYSLVAIGSYTGTQTVDIIPGIENRLRLGDEVVSFRMISCEPLSFTVGGEPFTISCETETPFICQKMIVNKGLNCHQKVVIKSAAALVKELAQSKNKKYRSLIIDFNAKGEKMDIHSPCAVEVAKNRSLKVVNICIAAQQGIKMNTGSFLKASRAHLLAPAGKVKAAAKSIANVETLYVSSKLVKEPKK